MTRYVQKPARPTKKAKADWVQWLHTYTPEKFLDSFLRSTEGAQSHCIYCRQKIYIDILIGGGVADWSTKDGDFGCAESPETTDEGCGGHTPIKRKGTSSDD